MPMSSLHHGELAAAGLAGSVSEGQGKGVLALGSPWRQRYCLCSRLAGMQGQASSCSLPRAGRVGTWGGRVAGCCSLIYGMLTSQPVWSSHLDLEGEQCRGWSQESLQRPLLGLCTGGVGLSQGSADGGQLGLSGFWGGGPSAAQKSLRSQGKCRGQGP